MKRRGFTLIEVMVALAIIAIVLAAASRVAATLTDSAGRLAEMTAAQWCADNALSNLKLLRQFPPTGETRFECSQLGRNYHGVMVTSATFNPNFHRVDARILDDGDRALLQLSTVIGRF